jgi:serine/threonine protein kinase
MEELGDVLCTLGQGRYSKVFCLKEKISNEIVAVKMYSRNRLQFRSKEILMEKEVLLRVRGHPGVAHLLRTHKDDDSLYFFMTPLLAGSLHQQILHCSGGLGPAVCRVHAAELVAALCHLASCGVTHRDLKANNVLLTDRGHIVLCDFGSAAIVGKTVPLAELTSLCEEESTTATGSIGTGSGGQSRLRRCYSLCGTVAYMAPEVRAIHRQWRQYEQQLQESLRRQQEQQPSSGGFSLESLSSQLEAVDAVHPQPPDPACSGLSYGIMVDWHAAGLMLYEMNFGCIVDGSGSQMSDEEDFPSCGQVARSRLLAAAGSSDAPSAGAYSVALTDLVLALTEPEERVRCGVLDIKRVLLHPYFAALAAGADGHGAFAAVHWAGIGLGGLEQALRSDPHVTAAVSVSGQEGSSSSDDSCSETSANKVAAVEVEISAPVYYDRSLGWFDVVAQQQGEADDVEVDQTLFQQY